MNGKRWMRGSVVPALLWVVASCSSSGSGGGSGHISLSASELTLKRGGWSSQVTAQVTDAHGQPISGTVTWASSDPSVATVDSSGLVTSGALGSAQVTASAGRGVSSTVDVQVVVQPNPKCTVPTSLPSPGAVGSPPTFQVLGDAFNVDAPPFDDRFLVPIDADGNGTQDLLVLTSNAPPSVPGGATLVYRNDGTGHFTDATAAILGSAAVPADQPSSFEVADLNGDGHPDAFVAQHGYGDAGAPSLLFLSNGGGTLAQAGFAEIDPNPSTSVTKATASGDVDCDGHVDVFESAIGPTGVQSLLMNDGTGALHQDDGRLPPEITDGTVSFTSAQLCDIDRDGDPELILGGWNGSGIKRDVLLLNDGFGNFRLAPDGALPGWHYGADTNVTLSIRCADLDQDGYPDLVVSQTDAFATGFVGVWKNQQNDTFASVDSAAVSWPTGYVDGLWASDFNGDGWPDLVVTGTGGNHLGRVYSNAGSMTFTAVDLPRDDQPLTPIEANGDGHPDLVAPGKSGLPILMLNQNGAAPSDFVEAQPGDRVEVPLGTVPTGHFHFEAKGFVDHFIDTQAGNAEFIYFWLYSGNNFYYEGDGAGFLYIPYEYAYDNYSCNYGKVKARSNDPGPWPIEICYMDQAWDSQHWYSFDVVWDTSTISIFVDGDLKNQSDYGSNSLPLIAGMGWPPADVEQPGIVGMEFRNWSFGAQ